MMRERTRDLVAAGVPVLPEGNSLGETNAWSSCQHLSEWKINMYTDYW